MGHFGEDLRSERESRGIALATIAGATKISSRHLEALESNDFQKLPGGVFNRNIVRSYARVAGLDEEAWVRRFVTETAPADPLTEEDAEWIHFAENVGRSRVRSGPRAPVRLRWAGVGMLVVLLAGLGWVVWRYVRVRVASTGVPSQAVGCAEEDHPVPTTEDLFTVAVRMS